MKICNLTAHSKGYTSNVYLVTGDWNTLEDKNTLIDVGMDERVSEYIHAINTGVGQKKISQVILTHSHYDHVWNLPNIVEEFSPTVYAHSQALQNVTHIAKEGQTLLLGDTEFEVIYTPEHSSDSICLYSESEKVLFTGDTPIFITSTTGSYNEKLLEFITRMSKKDLKAIYPGHGNPIVSEISRLLLYSLENAKGLNRKK